MKSFLIYYYYCFLVFLFIGWVASAAASFRDFKKEAFRISHRAWIWLLFIFNVAIVLRFFILSHHPQVFYDEVSFIETAENYCRYGLNVHNHWGLHRHDFLICPTGWPFLISLAFRATGPDINAAFALSAAMSVVTTVFVFMLVALLFENENAGLWSALIFSFFPIYARLSTSSAMGTSSLFFIFLTLLAMILYFRNRSLPLLYFSFFSLSFAVNIRQEAFATILPLLALFFLLFHPDLKIELKNPHFYVCLVLLIIFSIPPAVASIYGVSTGFYYFYESHQAMREHIISNLKYNVTYWFINEIHPLSVTLMAFMGFFAIWRTYRKLAFYFLLWFAFLLIFYSINPSCDFSLKFTIDSWRTAAHPAIPFILLAGPGTVLIVEYFRKNYRKATPLITIVLIIVIFFIPVRFYNFIQKKTYLAEEYLFVRDVTRKLPQGSRIILEGSLTPYLWESYSSLFNYNSPVPGRHYSISDDPYQEMNLLKDVWRWKSEENRRIFVYLKGVPDVEKWENMNFYNNFFKLKKVAEFDQEKVKLKNVFWEIIEIK